MTGGACRRLRRMSVTKTTAVTTAAATPISPANRYRDAAESVAPGDADGFAFTTSEVELVAIRPLLSVTETLGEKVPISVGVQFRLDWFELVHPSGNGAQANRNQGVPPVTTAVKFVDSPRVMDAGLAVRRTFNAAAKGTLSVGVPKAESLGLGPAVRSVAPKNVDDAMTDTLTIATTQSQRSGFEIAFRVIEEEFRALPVTLALSH